jgi:peptidyl-prolyl cis-trans isomerase SurA
MTKLKSMLKDDLRKQLKIEKLKQNKFGSGIRVSGTEVQQFYEQYKDSLPNVPETLELYQIVRIPELSEEAKRSRMIRLQQFLTASRQALTLLQWQKNILMILHQQHAAETLVR